MKSLRAEFHEVPLLPLEPVVDISGFAAVRCKLSKGQSSGAELLQQEMGWDCSREGLRMCLRGNPGLCAVHKGSAGVGLGWDTAVLTG